MTRRMPRILLIFVLIMSFVTVFLSVCAAADDTDIQFADNYSIKSADFVTEMTPTGDLIVNETWKLQYYEDGFTRFYKGIYLNVDEDEKFGEVKVESAKINGSEVEIIRLKSGDENMPLKCCALYKSKDSENIFWVHESKKGDVATYEVRYTLTNVVRRSGRNKAYYKFRFVGKNFTKDIQSLSIESKPVGDKGKAKCYYNEGDSTEKQDGYIYQKGGSSGLVKCAFVFDDPANDSYFTVDLKKGNSIYAWPFNPGFAVAGGFVAVFAVFSVIASKRGWNVSNSDSGYGCGSSCGGSGCGSSCGGGGCGGGGAS